MRNAVGLNASLEVSNSTFSETYATGALDFLNHLTGIPSEEWPGNSQIINQYGATSEIETCFAIGPQHSWCRGSQPNHESGIQIV